MKTLSHLIEEAEERFEKLTTNTHRIGSHSDDWGGSSDNICFCEIKQQFKTELINIVKESFKNTRVEEKKCDCRSCAGEDGEDCGDYMYDQALSDKHNKECEFLGN